ncbi:hypothetical protein SISNIDRAFT_412381 [Sistotremastrum niveocremeum HHB9708]|uniref:Uncharacterized protein n=1 Tax=Sistotremastrum niveocremeum HHB9708 TaxID=1314777 RepID=A0A164TQV3_9AGAM|nr:hypothetical protein SISNIDRAFT_412381 [Sistotremastrum niveocremeum HHB9708]
MRSFLTVLRTQRLRSLPSHRTAVPSRFASSSTSEKASEQAQKAYSSAQKNAEKVLEGTKKFAGSLGDRVGSLFGSYRQPLLYNLSVARELLKQVYLAERLQPPTSLSTIQSAYSTLWSRARSLGYWQEIARSGEWARVAVYGVEAYGIFKIGEILGRRSLVGYKLD